MALPMSPYAQLIHVARTYFKDGETVYALRQVDLEVQRQAWIVVVGESGAGKSTLLNILGGLDRPTAGEVYCDGVALNSLRSDELAQFRFAKVGFIFQSFNLIPTLTALENVELPLLPYEKERAMRRERARTALELVEMTHRANHLPGELSGGEQQRIAIARALINDPELLLADEPTGELDRRTGEKILALIASLHHERGMTIVMTSHDPAAGEFAQQVIWLESGQIVGADFPKGAKATAL